MKKKSEVATTVGSNYMDLKRYFDKGTYIPPAVDPSGVIDNMELATSYELAKTLPSEIKSKLIRALIPKKITQHSKDGNSLTENIKSSSED